MSEQLPRQNDACPVTDNSTSAQEEQQKQQQQQSLEQEGQQSLQTSREMPPIDEIMADPSKYVTLPIQNDQIWRKYQNTLEWFWTVYDVYLTNDYENMKLIFNEEQRQYVNKLLAFMYISHATVIKKELFMKLMTQVEIKEASYFFGSQADAKKTHSLMYSMLLDELVHGDIKMKENLISEVTSLPQVRNLLKWSILATNSESKSFAQRLLAFATLQGIVFTGFFVLFEWIKNQHPNKLPGLNNSNDLIWRDEKLNLSLSCLLFEHIEDELSEEEAHSIVREAVYHAKSLLTEALPVSIIGLECELMDQFIEHSADKILSDIHVAKIYNKESPFDWVVDPIKETYKSMYNVDSWKQAANFGEAKFSTDLDF